MLGSISGSKWIHPGSKQGKSAPVQRLPMLSLQTAQLHSFTDPSGSNLGSKHSNGETYLKRMKMECTHILHYNTNERMCRPPRPPFFSIIRDGRRVCLCVCLFVCSFVSLLARSRSLARALAPNENHCTSNKYMVFPTMQLVKPIALLADQTIK